MAELFSSQIIKSSKEGPNGLIIAGIHGDEYEPVLAVMRLIKKLEGRLISGSITLVPVTNRNAYFSGSRVGEDGLDLARTCPGNSNGSITERVAAKISELIKKADFFIDMHTGGNLFEISPLSGYMLHNDPSVLQKQREMAAAFNLPIAWGTSPELEGRTLSVARDGNIPAIYTENGGGAYRTEGVEELVDGCENVLELFGLLPQQKKKKKAMVNIEDDKPGSGHLQVMHPSPDEGVFIAKVSLGDFVKEGDGLGYIVNDKGEKSTQVLAQQSGMVFLKRAVPMAKAGDALAGILPIKK
ncbi:succinylglutamate desuccinylase/aspartoacylase family protein [Cyclobacterium marinum]|uniref:succinylglutamate desuccinylase/aspartoacylase family protein n=1 Tax=Cyclobacterium marinum TaxID=104 RepID=UPI0011EFA231|nr:M14 family metallopeptidase [Cyclobacterium marinum]MBI0399537.1 succinylglutamate desuccinylase/aspartoacylase family protein [Cyclobacterium marinum]